MNYINLQTKQLIIREHKNKKYKEIRTIDLKDDFTELIKNRVGKYLFTNTKDEVYSDNDKLNKNTVKKWFSLTFTQLRHILIDIKPLNIFPKKAFKEIKIYVIYR